MKKFTKEEAIAVVVQCAEKYHSELEGRNLLFLCLDRQKQLSSVELSFRANNYMHLTGLKPPKNANSNAEVGWFANEFYKKCLGHKLSPSDFDFADDGTTHMKLNVLPGIVCKNLHANIMGDYNSAKPRLYTEKLVGNVRACMGFVFDQDNLEYVPNTIIQEDIRNLTSNDARVIAVYRKSVHLERYEELTYKAKKVDWTSVKIPEHLTYLLPVQEIEAWKGLCCV